MALGNTGERFHADWRDADSQMARPRAMADRGKHRSPEQLYRRVPLHLARQPPRTTPE
jgi:hypothetical protein